MKQHPLCTDTEERLSVGDLPVPVELKREWSLLQTRRHFLGRSGKVLGWAAMARTPDPAAVRQRCSSEVNSRLASLDWP